MNNHWEYLTEIRENHVTPDYAETPVNALDLMQSHNALAKKGWELVGQSYFTRYSGHDYTNYTYRRDTTDDNSFKDKEKGINALLR